MSRVSLPAYRTCLALGLVLGVVVAGWSGRRRALPFLAVLDGALAALGGGLVVGRVGYVIANWPYFAHHVGEAVVLWHGGLSAPGALTGALVAVLILCSVRRTDACPILDCLAAGGAVVALSAWLGCLRSGCACGVEVWPDQGLLWRVSAELPDLHGLWVPRVAVPLLGAGWEGLTLGAILLAGQRGRPLPLWLFLHAGGEFGLGFLRGDLNPLAAGLAPIQIADLALALLGLGLLVAPAWGGPLPTRE